jgi:hypothetical protein
MVAGTANWLPFDARMILVGAGIAVVACLATAALSWFFQSRRDAARRAQAEQLESARRRHEAGLRFGDERLAGYTDFVGAITHLATAASVWLARPTDGRFVEAPGLELDPYIKSFARARMLAGAALLEKIERIDVLVQQLIADNGSPRAIERITADLLAATGAFETAAKDELGIR